MKNHPYYFCNLDGSFFRLDVLSWPADARTSNEMHALHDESVRLYRDNMRLYRQQGKSFAEAQRLALATDAKGTSH